VSRIIIGKLDCSRSGTSRRQVKLNSAQLTESSHDRLAQIGALVRLTDRVDNDRADLGLHGPAVPRGPDTEQFHNPLIKVSDTHRGHGHHPFLLAMLARRRRGSGEGQPDGSQEGTRLRIRVVSTGYHRDWQVQFPKGIRKANARYVVTEVREANRGGFYRALGDIRRIV
jgi:hypothetical protein